MLLPIPPLNLVGVWVALEDVQEGSGELMYLAKSHKFSLFFHERTGRVHWNRSEDSDEMHRAYGRFLKEYVRTGDCSLLKFLPKKGDVLIWHSQLAHGGVSRKNSQSRKSIVGHFCPKTTQQNWSTGEDEPLVWNTIDGKSGAEMVSQYY